jgi:hypothetical protein
MQGLLYFDDFELWLDESRNSLYVEFSQPICNSDFE